RNKHCPSKNMFSKLFVLIIKQQKPTNNQARKKHQKKRWKNPSDSPHVEFQDTERFEFQFFKQYSGYQISGYYEEYVYPDESAWYEIRKCVINHDRKNGNCS